MTPEERFEDIQNSCNPFENAEIYMHKRVELLLTNTWKEDKSLSLGGYIDFCAENKELTLSLYLVFIDICLYINFKRKRNG